MALAGQGDPRWVVRERADGHNINNWHWSGERDVLPWARTRLRALFTTTGSNVRVSSVADAEGDAHLYNRKGQRKAVWDLKVSGVWEESGDDEARTRGKFVVEVLVGDDDPDVVVSTDYKVGKGDPEVKKAFVKHCVPKIVEGCRAFALEMAAGAEGAEGIANEIQEAEKAKKAAEEPKKTLEEKEVKDYMRTEAVDISSKEFQAKAAAKAPLVIRENFSCAPADLKAALVTDRGRLEAVTRGRVECDVRVGGKWAAGGADGVFRVMEDWKIVFERWGMGGWKSEQRGVLTLEFKDVEGKTELLITGEGIAVEKRGAVEGFWRLQVFRPVKMLFGYGSASFM